ncbi:hypothetical protein [Paenibacillus sp. SI8]|uniref:hypothetical protein n=1 Tax=unclassified Paenibacillus TaxID=185978 RepID=UPI003466C893
MPRRKPEIVRAMICSGGRFYSGSKVKVARVQLSDGRIEFYRIGDVADAYAMAILLPVMVGEAKIKPVKMEDIR